MATHALTPSNPSRRRTLFAGAGAIILGSGISAGVADLVPAEPDGELIAFCSSYVKADIQHAELCRQQDALIQPLSPRLNAEWHRLDDLVLEQGIIMLNLEPKIAALPAVSQVGVQAKAAAVARMSRFYKDDNGAVLLRSLLADLLPTGRA